MTGFGTMFLFMMPFVVAGIVLGVLEYRKTENEVKKAALLAFMQHWELHYGLV